MQHKAFYGRQKIRLGDLRAVRSEMVRAYHACVRKELNWQDYRAATLGLQRLAMLDAGQLLDQRLSEIEARLAAAEGPPPRPNGHAHAQAAR